MLDGQPIFAALSGVENPSRNSKTGAMLQTWVMRSDMGPFEAVKTNADASVCGGCSHRGDHGVGRSCYVILFHAPNQVYKHRDDQKPLPKLVYHNRAVRLGGYGDHAALPTAITADIAKKAMMTTGYTHQWKTCDQDLRKYLMASCDSVEDRELANALGWATFRVKTVDQPKLKGETLCPASAEAGKILTCLTCGKCSGGDVKDVVIDVHGVGHRHFTLRQAA